MSFWASREGEKLIWQWPGCRLTLQAGRPVIAGILNITPDSFSDGGRYYSAAPAASREEPGAAVPGIEGGLALARQGAGIIDVGGQSTRPGYQPITPKEELDRVLPVLAGLAKELPPKVAVSLDTDKPEVAEEVLSRGLARILNDESGGSQAMARIAARYKVPVILMHRPADNSRGSLEAVSEDLSRLRESYLEAGCAPEAIALDPGLGFGKTGPGNLELLARMRELQTLGAPLYIGASRKSFIGLATKVPFAGERLGGSVGAALWAAQCGAHFVRVHDVQVTREALAVYCLLKEQAEEREKKEKAHAG